MNFGPGSILELDEKQAKARIHNLKKVKSGIYKVVRVVQFKNGEEVGFDGDIPKTHISMIEPMESAKGKIDPTLEKYLGMGVEALQEEAKKRELNPHHKAGKEKLIDLLVENDKKAAGEE